MAPISPFLHRPPLRVAKTEAPGLCLQGPHHVLFVFALLELLIHYKVFALQCDLALACVCADVCPSKWRAPHFSKTCIHTTKNQQLLNSRERETLLESHSSVGLIGRFRHHTLVGNIDCNCYQRFCALVNLRMAPNVSGNSLAKSYEIGVRTPEAGLKLLIV